MGAFQANPYRGSTELPQRMEPPTQSFNASPINPTNELGQFNSQRQFLEYEGGTITQQENSTFFLTKTPHQTEELQKAKGSELMYEKIDTMIKDLMKSIQEKCDKMEESIEQIIKEEV